MLGAPRVGGGGGGPLGEKCCFYWVLVEQCIKGLGAMGIFVVYRRMNKTPPKKKNNTPPDPKVVAELGGRRPPLHTKTFPSAPAGGPAPRKVFVFEIEQVGTRPQLPIFCPVHVTAKANPRELCREGLSLLKAGPQIRVDCQSYAGDVQSAGQRKSHTVILNNCVMKLTVTHRQVAS